MCSSWGKSRFIFYHDFRWQVKRCYNPYGNSKTSNKRWDKRILILDTTQLPISQSAFFSQFLSRFIADWSWTDSILLSAMFDLMMLTIGENFFIKCHEKGISVLLQYIHSDHKRNFCQEKNKNRRSVVLLGLCNALNHDSIHPVYSDCSVEN